MVQRINTIKAVLKKKKSVLVLGPRGSGKTYFVNHLLESFPNKLKIDLLDGALYRRYLNQPEQLSKDILNTTLQARRFTIILLITLIFSLFTIKTSMGLQTEDIPLISNSAGEEEREHARAPNIG